MNDASEEASNRAMGRQTVSFVFDFFAVHDSTSSVHTFLRPRSWGGIKGALALLLAGTATAGAVPGCALEVF